MSIAVIAGLGNPGPNYCNTRHNIGFYLVDWIAKQHKLLWKVDRAREVLTTNFIHGGRKVLLVKPQCYMNQSGPTLACLLRYYRFELKHLLVIYDDIGLEVGRSKLTFAGGSGGHNGIQSIVDALGSDFLRYRIGIGAKPNKEMDLAEYVLSTFNKHEQLTLANRLEHYGQHIERILTVDRALAMNHINQKNSLPHT
ncbi:MAG: aminoacyl-tRNA hydrolase [Opitutales bacterium]